MANYPWTPAWCLPGNCTDVFQSCDIGIQQVLEHAVKGPGRRCVLSTSMGNVPRLRFLYPFKIRRAQWILSENQERDEDETPGVIADLFRYSLLIPLDPVRRCRV